MSEYSSDSTVGGAVLAGAVVSYFCGAIVFINLIIHFLLRGLWIGAVGLRSVSGDINFHQLRLSNRFNRFLRHRISSFDDYIIGLDRICSVIFSFSFLLALLLIGFFFYWGVMILIMYGIMQFAELVDVKGLYVGPFIFMAIYLVLGLLYLLDFMTLGWVKRIRWLSRFYYPVYRFFGFVTLARIYRPLYYNFIDDKFGRRMVLIAVPYILLILVAVSFSFQGGPFYDARYFSDQEIFEGEFSKEFYYENLREDDLRQPSRYLVGADMVSRPINKVSLFILPEYAATIECKFPEVNRLNESVLNSEFIVGFNNAKRTMNADEKKPENDFINYFREIFELRLNGRQLNMDDAVLFDSKNYPFPKLVKYLPLSRETPGLQQLEITRFEYSRNGDSLRPIKKVLPFYYQPN
ncbi:hypothetical protein CEQ90_16800 [Lewinellaceae bacterium SD302]|nr:hypothetical protein CEQ90_16800 [Lewinellaceae bacterium SD302]